MASDEPPLRPRFTHDQQLTDARDAPPTLAGEESRHDPALPRHRGMQILHVGDPALDLHQKERLMLRMPPDEVDGSSIAEVVERVLHEDLPATTAHDRGDSVDERCMLPVEKPRKLTAAPEWLDRNANLEGATDRTQAAKREPFELAGLRQRDELLAHACTECDITLAPPEPAAYSAKYEPGP